MIERFPPDRASVREARMCAKFELLDAPEQLREQALLLVSELATNAVVHAQTDYVVELDREGHEVFVGVTDNGPGLRALQDDDEDAVGGRGLRIVMSLCKDWGVTSVPGGKQVWGRLPASDSPDSLAQLKLNRISLVSEEDEIL